MRKVIVSEFITLDGVIESPHLWSLDYWRDEIGAFKDQELFACDALLLGRVTYQGFAAAWPQRSDDDGYADRINNMPKHVVSTTLSALTWQNSALIDSNVVQAVQQLKAGDGQDLLVFGSGTLIQTLIRHKLVDRYHLLVYPLVVGEGQRLFEHGDTIPLELVENRRFDSGVVLLVYETQRNP
ncbi:MAG: dihydrofolate reductase family protein [Anaerolineales bacterium]|nr:dihydrofolate reductase family protein [Anaerolineales bacterium]MCB9172458.1 dihydrofolate reductase family protein [Ardenticatenales bacterium]